ncbi:hypothetical protein [Streptomyces sp. NBC_00696]|uniref:hypothetical protein n=1 Tax=Streptomyces sp. NBC_00696 TaxID=2903672 RepID=UPI002E359A55|nr:hypothetical protein [Streptomyces sp. NBC_00696]
MSRVKSDQESLLPVSGVIHWAPCQAAVSSRPVSQCAGGLHREARPWASHTCTVQ